MSHHASKNQFATLNDDDEPVDTPSSSIEPSNTTQSKQTHEEKPDGAPWGVKKKKKPEKQSKPTSNIMENFSGVYSREEILSLFKLDYTIPNDLVMHEKIVSPVPLTPVAFQPMDPEEVCTHS